MSASTGSASPKRIALTFDDGPNEPYTSQLLDYLDKQNIKATFFQVGTCIQRFPEITQRADRQGHIIGNHTHTHRFSNHFQATHIQQEIENTQRTVQDVIGKTPLLFRAPWFFHTPALQHTLSRFQLISVMGSLPHPFESLQPSSRRIANHALAQAHDGAILIFHDGYKSKGGDRSRTIAAAQLTVQALRQEGYEFVTVDQLLGVPAYQTLR